jgi:hypothetical protein
MSVSVSGVLTLAVLVGIGPIFYGCKIFYRRYKGIVIDLKETKEGADGCEELSSKAYLFALLGYAIGIGNIWQFPYFISQNGGGAALVAYIICAIPVAAPLFLYEMIVGQHTCKSSIQTWCAIRPRWASFGVVAQWMLLLTVNCYFAMVVTYTIP